MPDLPQLSSLFGLSVSPLEIVLRGSVVYWFLFAVFRGVLRRDAGSIAIADVLLLVLIADAAQNAMAGEYKTISDGLILVSTIIAWNVAIDWIAFRVPALRRILVPPELCLVRNGRIQRRNMRKEFISDEELEAKLREHGVSGAAEVRAAYMESDGSISVIKRK